MTRFLTLPSFAIVSANNLQSASLQVSSCSHRRQKTATSSYTSLVYRVASSTARVTSRSMSFVGGRLSERETERVRLSIFMTEKKKKTRGSPTPAREYIFQFFRPWNRITRFGRLRRPQMSSTVCGSPHRFTTTRTRGKVVEDYWKDVHCLELEGNPFDEYITLNS